MHALSRSFAYRWDPIQSSIPNLTYLCITYPTWFSMLDPTCWRDQRDFLLSRDSEVLSDQASQVSVLQHMLSLTSLFVSYSFTWKYLKKRWSSIEQTVGKKEGRILKGSGMGSEKGGRSLPADISTPLVAINSQSQRVHQTIESSGEYEVSGAGEDRRLNDLQMERKWKWSESKTTSCTASINLRSTSWADKGGSCQLMSSR